MCYLVIDALPITVTVTVTVTTDSENELDKTTTYARQQGMRSMQAAEAKSEQICSLGRAVFSDLISVWQCDFFRPCSICTRMRVECTANGSDPKSRAK